MLSIKSLTQHVNFGNIFVLKILSSNCVIFDSVNSSKLFQKKVFQNLHLQHKSFTKGVPLLLENLRFGLEVLKKSTGNFR